jgi:SAM-dependent methyltransferase
MNELVIDPGAVGYAEKRAGYFANARRALFEPLPRDAKSVVLELGCGAGATGALALSEGRCGAWVGVEKFAGAARTAEMALTRVHVGDIEVMELPYPSETFDALICGDVLEHLIEPGEALKRLVPLLKPGARFVASVPNISNWRILLALLRGSFDYVDEGAMDRTHLRWFTPATLRRLIEDAGLEVDCLRALGMGPGKRLLTKIMPFGHLLWYQIEAHAHKPQAALERQIVASACSTPSTADVRP